MEDRTKEEVNILNGLIVEVDKETDVITEEEDEEENNENLTLVNRFEEVILRLRIPIGVKKVTNRPIHRIERAIQRIEDIPLHLLDHRRRKKGGETLHKDIDDLDRRRPPRRRKENGTPPGPSPGGNVYESTKRHPDEIDTKRARIVEQTTKFPEKEIEASFGLRPYRHPILIGRDRTRSDRIRIVT